MSESKLDKPAILSQNLFPVVGIGASAGGLDAFKKLVKAIPEQSGMAYILVQHLHPEHESALPEILQRLTKVPVVEISDNVKVLPDHIYVIPSNKMMVATDGILKLSPRLPKDKLNLPIDIFFSSLAEVHQSHAIGIVLSGNGADGSVGLRDIKDNGGLTMAQDPASAGYTGMPQHAIEASIVDFIVTPEKIPAKLAELQQSFSLAGSDKDTPAADKKTEDAFRQILVMIRIRIGVDFSYYKQTTIRRRIVRRMLMVQSETVSNYLDYLKKNKPEQEILFNDLLIPVSSFFRDSKIFDSLCETVFPVIAKDKSITDPLRIWIAGCSTGQEAYSIAMCCHEYLSDHISNVKVQIFATDLSEKSIKKARLGYYTNKETEGLSEIRLENFMVKADGGYKVNKTIRDMCVFAVHNFVKDPPFAKMDLISCRNVLIYFDSFLQKKAMTIFHYALKEKGILWLGKSETTGTDSKLFAAHSGKEKFYSRKVAPGRFMNVATERKETAFTNKNLLLAKAEGKPDDFQKNADDILLSQYTPVGVVVNDQYDIVQFRGLTGEYLEPSPGKASLNVLKMAKAGLAFEIRNALHKAKKESETVIKTDVPLEHGNKLVTIEVVPLLNTVDLHFLILFKSQLPLVPASVKGSSKNKPVSDIRDTRIDLLEKELAQLRESIRSVTEDQEAANEELQSSNEELLSGSEELQSLNEELETSKEELQSTNEELISVNQELFEKNEELNQSRKFAEATIALLHEPLIVLDKDLQIRSANAAFYKTFRLLEEETIGSQLFELQDSHWDIPELRQIIKEILKGKEKMIEAELRFIYPAMGEMILCANLQTLNRDTGEQLIIMALEDITRKKNAEILQENARKILEQNAEMIQNLYMNAPAFICTFRGPTHIYDLVNPSYQMLFGKRKLVGKAILDALPELKGQGIDIILSNVYNTGETFVGLEIPMILSRDEGKEPQLCYFNFSYQPIYDVDKMITGVLVFGYEVTEEFHGKKILAESSLKFAILANAMPQKMWTADEKGNVNYFNQQWFDYTHKSFDELKNLGWESIIHPDDWNQNKETWLQSIKTGEHFQLEHRFLKYDGTYHWHLSRGLAQKDKDGKAIVWIGTHTDIDEQKIAEEKIMIAEAFSRNVLQSSPDCVKVLDNEGIIYFMNSNGLCLMEIDDFNIVKNKLWSELWGNENKEIIDEALTTARSGKTAQFQAYCPTAKGTPKWWDVIVSPIIGLDGNVTQMISVSRDITERIQMEQKKDEFISIASHEMKTPLTTAKAYLQLLELELSKENTKANLYATKATHSVLRLNELVSELLDVSKIQHGKLDYNISSFNFTDMVNDTVESFEYSSPNRTIILSGKPMLFIRGDKDRLQQVIINLLSNAIKYSPSSAKVYINIDQEKDQLKISVKDSGVGISKIDINRIFDRYYRVEQHSSQFQGLGIGLFISHEIVERHNGKLWAESEAGKGSTFHCLIPTNQ